MAVPHQWKAIKKIPNEQHSALQQQCQSKKMGSDPIYFNLTGYPN
jgi:hypothetical protein